MLERKRGTFKVWGLAGTSGKTSGKDSGNWNANFAYTLYIVVYERY